MTCEMEKGEREREQGNKRDERSRKRKGRLSSRHVLRLSTLSNVLTATTCELPLRRPEPREGARGDSGRAEKPRLLLLEERAAERSRDDDDDEEVAAAAAGDDNDGYLLIATTLRGAVVDAAALDRARAWSMLEDISKRQGNERDTELFHLSKRRREKGESGLKLGRASRAYDDDINHHFFVFLFCLVGERRTRSNGSSRSPSRVRAFSEIFVCTSSASQQGREELQRAGERSSPFLCRHHQHRLRCRLSLATQFFFPLCSLSLSLSLRVPHATVSTMATPG